MFKGLSSKTLVTEGFVDVGLKVRFKGLGYCGFIRQGLPKA